MQIQHTKNENALRFFTEFTQPNATLKRYIFGHNQYSKSLIKELLKYDIKIDSIIDDFTSQTHYEVNQTYKLPIIKLESLFHNLPKCKIKVVVVTSQTKKAVQKVLALQEALWIQGVDLDFVDYFAIQRAAKQSSMQDFHLLELEFFDSFKRSCVHLGVSTYQDFLQDYANNQARYQAIFERLDDVESKIQFEKIINFRLNQDYAFMQDFDFTPLDQYFEPFYNLKGVKYFFDIGAYRGETSLEFAKRCPHYEKIYYFEPDKENFNKAQQNIESKLSNTQGFNIALANKDGSMFFCSDDTSSHIIENLRDNTQYRCSIAKLDTLMQTQIHLDTSVLDNGGEKIFVKMDIESAEELAIYGMKSFICTYTPILAVCVYHSFNDLINIPEIILALNPSYKMYFRHYSSGLTESVMFFVPKQ